jgi:hypothetical protein
MQFRYPLFAAFWLTALVAEGQDTARFQLGLGMGLTFDGVKVDLTSAAPHKGVAVPLQLSFSENRAKMRSSLLVTYVNINYKSDVSAFSTREQKGYLQSTYFYRLPLDAQRLRFFAGGLLDLQAYRRTNSFNGSEYGNNTAVGGTTSVCPGLFAELLPKRGLFTFQLSTAIFSYFGGSGYALSFPADSKWMWPGQYTVTQFRVAYHRQVAARFVLRADYQFTYRWFEVNESIGWVSSQALVSLLYSFGKQK